MVRRVCRYIDEHANGNGDGGPPTLADMGDHVGVSPHHLQRTFKRHLGVTPRQYADARRLGRFKSGLKRGEGVAGALYDAGYGSPSRVYERAPDQLGMTPATYAKGGRGAHIGYSVVGCTLGRLLVAATARGICAVYLGDDDDELADELRAEYPAAEVARDDAVLGRWAEVLVRHLKGEEPRLDLPLDVRATAFQWRVWEELRRIPQGETRTYSEIAARLGKPKAQRAVGRACATNPVSVVVPCHRAVREDGGLGGYRWGLERKEALLARERTEKSELKRAAG
jgi:AraC family transcriptional regulator of adaptative response/methylated-DNA-[protein]-cysteine methyltransferase